MDVPSSIDSTFVSSSLELLPAVLVDHVSLYLDSCDLLISARHISQKLRKMFVVKHLFINAHTTMEEMLRSVPPHCWNALLSLRLQENSFGYNYLNMAADTIREANGFLSQRLLKLHLHKTLLVEEAGIAKSMGIVITEPMRTKLRELSLSFTLSTKNKVPFTVNKHVDDAIIAMISNALPALEHLALRIYCNETSLNLEPMVANSVLIVAIPGRLRALVLEVDLWYPQYDCVLAAHAPYLESLHLESRYKNAGNIILPAFPNAHTIKIVACQGSVKIFELAASPHLKLVRLTMDRNASLDISPRNVDNNISSSTSSSLLSSSSLSCWQAPLLRNLYLDCSSSSRARECLSSENGTSCALDTLRLYESIEVPHIIEFVEKMTQRTRYLHLDIDVNHDSLNLQSEINPLFKRLLKSDHLVQFWVYHWSMEFLHKMQAGCEIQCGRQLKRITTINEFSYPRPLSLPSHVEWNTTEFNSISVQDSDGDREPVPGRWSSRFAIFE